eukprot:TRINITY_DN43235_c0_g1_i2.p1 TRINITY_DN43235_c0_g1~~TRINITY_DN43235_c0_g1_i2.p1  ORF type:complete len:608 (+),score=119.16 TRINITY_DN43235_c0_g1_i2:77-1900(+)
MASLDCPSPPMRPSGGGGASSSSAVAGYGGLRPNVGVQEHLLSQAPPTRGVSSASSVLGQRGSFSRFMPGEPVFIYSNSAKAWVNGRIEEVFAQPCVADGYSVPAGCIKVVMEDGGIKYVMPDQVDSTLRHAPGSRSSGSGGRQQQPAPPPRSSSAGGYHSGGSSQHYGASGPEPDSEHGNPPPTGRAEVGAQRLESRDRWNTYEIRLQEIFMEYDRDRSGALEVQEFRDLLRDFNEGKDPTEQEYGFIMRLSDKDADGRISLGELHYALRAWHAYRHLDESVLRLFAEFDFDESGRLDADELGNLLTCMNGGKPVPRHEVLRVLAEADVLGDHAISRSELLGAIAAWYGNVDRKDTDLPSLLREAIARTIKETDHVSAFDQGKSMLNHAASMVKGFIGYSQVDDGTGVNSSSASTAPTSNMQVGPWPPSSMAAGSMAGGTPAFDPELADQPMAVRLAKASPLILSSTSKFCYVAFPFIFGWIMASTGWSHRDNSCPRNLDGILLWFGILTLVFSGLAYVSDPNAALGRIAILVILGVLNIVGFLWTMDQDVQQNIGACHQTLVWFSSFVWIMVPICALGYGGFLLASHMKQLQRKDDMLQNEVIIF